MNTDTYKQFDTDPRIGIDGIDLNHIYRRNLQLLTFDGAVIAYRHLLNISKHFRNFIVGGVGFPFYWIKDEDVNLAIDPSNFQEFSDHNTSRSIHMSNLLVGEKWKCPSCKKRTSNKECCLGSNRPTVYEVMRSVFDVDIFVFVPDDIYDFILPDIHSRLVEIGCDTWDGHNLESTLPLYIQGGFVYSDVHVFSFSQLKNGLRVLINALKSLHNGDISDFNVFVREFDHYAWRGSTLGFEVHKIRLFFDICFSLYVHDLHEQRERDEEINNLLVELSRLITCCLSDDILRKFFILLATARGGRVLKYVERNENLDALVKSFRFRFGQTV